MIKASYDFKKIARRMAEMYDGLPSEPLPSRLRDPLLKLAVAEAVARNCTVEQDGREVPTAS